MNTGIRTYRIRDYTPSIIDEYDKTFFSKNFQDGSFELEYKGHKTTLTKRNNQDLFITTDDYKGEGIIIHSGVHRIKKGVQIEVEDDTNIKAYDSYFIPNIIEFFNFPNKNLLFTRASKDVFKHVDKGIEKKYDYKLPQKEVNLVELAKHEENIIGVNIKPNTPKCETIVGYGNNVNSDEKIEEIINNPNTFLSNVMIKVPFNEQEVVVTITHDCGIVIYKWNEQLEYDLDLVFHIYNTIITKYLI